MSETQNMILATYYGNYADEFDVSGFAFFTPEEWKEFKETAESHDTTIEWYFGSNQKMTWNSGQELLKSLRVSEIPLAEAKTAIKILGQSFGLFPEIY